VTVTAEVRLNVTGLALPVAPPVQVLNLHCLPTPSATGVAAVRVREVPLS